MRTSTSYRFTINMINGRPATDAEQKELDDFRATVSACNKYGAQKMYVKLQGRLGENNPAAEKYGRGPKSRYYNHQAIRLKDASRADVYVYTR